jgi:REP element-mobilizing transposase RayT
MPPKRLHIDGLVYYVTTVTQGRLRLFVRPSFVIPLIDSLNFYRYKCTFGLLGYVIMPDHVHLLIWPHGTGTTSDIMRDVKHFTSSRIARQAVLEGETEWLTAFEEAGERTGRADLKVWQDSFWEQGICSDRFVRQKLNYMHRNPVRAGLVQEPGDYPYSSYRFYALGDRTLIEMDDGWQ